jgi:hypothetical protein
LRPIPAAAVLTLVLALAAAWATTASADVGERIIELCKEHRSIAGYTFADYQRALRDMAADLSEYSECEELVVRAEQAAATSKTGVAPAGGVTPGEHRLVISTDEQRAIGRASLTPARVRVGGRLLVPGVAHADIASAVNDLPIPLLATLVLLCGGLLLTVGRGFAGIVRRRRSPQ